jgi:hypothetical protein
MLSQDDRQRLEEIERYLMADDPMFVARMRSTRRLPPIDLTTVALAGVWTVSFGAALLLRSTAMVVALLAILAIETGWRLLQRHRRAADLRR